MTLLPLKSAREILPPPLVLAVKAGASSPSFSFNSIAFAIFAIHLDDSRFNALPASRLRWRAAGETARTGTQLPHAVVNVKQTGYARKDRRADREIQNPPFAPRFVPPQQNPEHRGHLQHGGHLADDARAHANFSHGE